ERRVAIADLSDDLDVRLVLEDGPQTAANDGVIVGDDHAQLAVAQRRSSFDRNPLRSLVSKSSTVVTSGALCSGIGAPAGAYGMVARTIVPRSGSLLTTS